jgi:hypothetical protein
LTVQKQIIYVDRLSARSLFALSCSRTRYSDIYFFGITSTAQRAIDWLVKLKVLRSRPCAAGFSLADMRDEKGECQFVVITEDATALCREISAREFSGSRTLQRMAQGLDLRKVVLFFEKALFEQIKMQVVYLHAARWHARTVKEAGEAKLFLLMEKSPWPRSLSYYAASRKVSVIAYRTLMTHSTRETLARVVSLIGSNIGSLSGLLKRRPQKGSAKQTQDAPQRQPERNALIASWYTGRTVTFDLRHRSDLFWLLKSPIPREQVLVYFDRADLPVTGEMADILSKEQVRSIALSGPARTSPAVPVWSRGPAFAQTLRSQVLRVAREALRGVLTFHPVRWFLISNMLIFAWYFSYWYDFFRSQGIKINVNPFDFSRMSICMHLAIERNNGVGISYQWSNLSFASTQFGSGATTLFSFGPAYRGIFEQSRSAADNLAYCGYITDYSFPELKERSLNMRKLLQDRGVTFTICYFDENSSDDRMSVIPNSRSTEIYKRLIERMLEDRTIGLIFKPGYPKTLRQRIASIQGLLDQAIASGRCLLMDKGSYVTEQYPAEAAQAADLCIGLLLSGTVALESFLTGTPTIFLDLEGLYSNPIYRNGRGNLVFDDLNKMFAAITNYRKNAQGIPGFGDLSQWAGDRDPYKDNNAALRIGQYINWLSEMLNQGRSREDALQYANRQYREQWGAGSIDTVRSAKDPLSRD